jgi:hypothetical protein
MPILCVLIVTLNAVRKVIGCYTLTPKTHSSSRWKWNGNQNNANISMQLWEELYIKIWFMETQKIMFFYYTDRKEK